MRYFAILIMCFTAAVSFAFETSNAGMYAVVHKDGYVTNFHFSVSQQSGTWNIQQRLNNGQWKNVTCERDCILKVSSESEIENFIPQDIRARQKYECIHNSAFAFCAYSPVDDMTRRGYALIALVTKKPIPIRLKKIE